MSSTVPESAESPYAPAVRALDQRILRAVRDDRAALTPDQERAFRDHLRRTDARETCPICDTGRWSVALRGDWIARTCARCGHVLLFDPAALGLSPGWRLREGRLVRALLPIEGGSLTMGEPGVFKAPQ